MFDVVKMITVSYLPEFIITLFVIANIIGSLFFATHFYKLSKWFTLLGIVLALVSTFYLQIEPEVYAFNGVFLTNVYTVYFKILILISGFFLTLLSRNMIREKRDRAFEYFAVFLAGILFAMCAVSVTNFISLFVTLEALGLCCYFLLSFTKTPNSKQLTFGYLVQSAVVSSLFLFGLSLIYGVCSCFEFEGISDYFANVSQPQLLLTLSLLLMMSSFLFKLGLVPFSSWLPDTFKGANTPICAYMSCIPVLACFGMLSKILLLFFNYTYIMKVAFAFIAVITILCGSLSAIRQSNLKRLMAYSMSVHSGVMLLGLCVFSVYSLSSVLFYMFCYLLANIGAWAAIVLLYSSLKLKELSDLNGLFVYRPYLASAFSVVLFSLAGIVPTCGFVAKLYIFSAVARSGFVFLPFLIFALLGLVINLFSYWRIVREIFKRNKNKDFVDAKIISPKLVLYLCAVGTILVFVFADKLIGLCQLVAYYI